MDLGQTLLCVSEDDCVVELCARVTSPDIYCPVTFPFDIGLPPSNHGEGREHANCKTYTAIGSKLSSIDKVLQCQMPNASCFQLYSF